MDQVVRPDKSVTRKFVVDFAPQYAEILRDFQRLDKNLRLPHQFLAIRENLKIHNYVELYNNEEHLNGFLFLALLGEDQFKTFNAELAALPRAEQIAWLNQIVRDAAELDVADFFPPDSEEARKQIQEQFEQLPEEERNSIFRRGQFFWSFSFAHFFNLLSLMVHGAKLTSLVPQAVAGDKDSFCKAIQIDRSLTTYHPYFRQRRLEAQERGEIDFLNEINYRERNPTLRGKIRHPGVYGVCLPGSVAVA